MTLPAVTEQTFVVEEKLINLELEVQNLKKFRNIVQAQEVVLVEKSSQIVELSFEVKRLGDTIAVYKDRIKEMTLALHTVATDSKEDLVFTAQPRQLGKAMFANKTVFMHFDSITRKLNYLETDTE